MKIWLVLGEEGMIRSWRLDYRWEGGVRAGEESRGNEASRRRRGRQVINVILICDRIGSESLRIYISLKVIAWQFSIISNRVNKLEE